MSGVGKFIQNNTVVGGILPPKQPWAAKFRADEETYDLYLNAGKLFDDSGITPTKSGGILSGLKKAIGIGTNQKFTGLRANPLFYFPDTEGNLNVDTGFMSTKNDGKQNFKSLASNPSEASAIQFLNHFGNETLEDEYEEIWSNSVPEE